MVNKAMMVGRLGNDPELRYTPDGKAVANFSIATSEKWKDKGGEMVEKTEWIRVVAWGKLAEIIGQHVRKGSMIYVEGPLQTRQWQGKDGSTNYTTELNCREMKMLGGRPQNNAEQEGPQYD